MIQKIFIFLILNFTALTIGSLCTQVGVHSDWYTNLHKAPWTPPSYVFGIAWSTIMCLFAVYMAMLTHRNEKTTTILIVYSVQLFLNTIWNPIFFSFHQAFLGLITIVLLTLLISWFLVRYFKKISFKSLLIVPYFLWLLIATSLNLYIVLYN